MKSSAKLGIITVTLLLLNIASVLSQNNIFWEVESKTGGTVFLLGSIHFADSSFYPLAPVIEESFQKSDYLVTEIDLSKINQMQMIAKVSYPLTDSLAGHIADTTMTKLVKYFSTKGMSRQMLNRFKPAFITMMISQFESANAGITPEYGIDIHFTKKAKERKMKILELENADYQLQVLDMMNKEGIENKVINSALEDANKTNENVKELAENWKKGDLIAIDSSLKQMSEEDIPENKDFYEELIDKRNIAMTEKVIEYLSDNTKKNYFVIAGAAHLIGDKGIIKLLEQRGYKAIRK